MQTVKQKKFTSERACFDSKNVHFEDCIFEDGESPLKQSSDIIISGGFFRWKYPLWYCKNVEVNGTCWTETARAGVWYTKNLSITDSIIQAPKTFRRSSAITLTNVLLSKAQETLWNCSDVILKNVQAVGDYFAMNCHKMEIDNLNLSGNYSFDGAKDVTIRNSKLITKDAFWNSKNVTVFDSLISGEYLGWNSQNLTLVNCTIESLQGMCYCQNLTMRDCKLIDTTLAFEYSSVDVVATTKIDSVFNVKSGYIAAPQIDELIIENGVVKTKEFFIDCPNVGKKSDKPEWK